MDIDDIVDVTGFPAHAVQLTLVFAVIPCK